MIQKEFNRSFKTINIYIFSEFLLSFAVSFSFFFFIFFVNQLLLMAEQILSKNVPITDVLLLLLFSFPSIIAISFPFATLLGALMAMGHFSSKNEILAFQSSGVSMRRLFRPLFYAGIGFSLISFFINDYFLPLGAINLNRLYRELVFSAPEMELEPYSVKRYQNSIIITGDIKKGEFSDLIIIDEDEKNNKRVISAKRGYMSDEGESMNVVGLVLHEVLSHSVSPRRGGVFDYDQSSKMQYNLLLNDISQSIQSPGPHEMSSRDVFYVIQEKKKILKQEILEHNRQVMSKLFDLEQSYVPYVSGNPHISVSYQNELMEKWQSYNSDKNKVIRDRSLEIWRLEFYQKFSIPFSCLPFVILAFPLGTFSRRSGKSIGFAMGLLLTVVYWGMLFAGRNIGINGIVHPVVAMWMPNTIILVLGLILLARRLAQ